MTFLVQYRFVLCYLTNNFDGNCNVAWLVSAQVVDVAKAIVSAVRDPDAGGKTYALVG